MEHEFNETEDVGNDNTPQPRHYEIHTTSGVKFDQTGFIGINDSYVAVASLEGRMIFGMPLSNLDYFTAVEKPLEHIGTGTKN